MPILFKTGYCRFVPESISFLKPWSHSGWKIRIFFTGFFDG